ncbi:hypothetical protein AB0J63_26635 [Streptosporangium canum]|uniref:hypothetical protein n=1 Tax=Streptosporangium canum TaxID=324952 RepID=UPI00343F3708
MSAATVPPRPPLVMLDSRMAWLRAWRKGEAQWMALVFYAEDDGHRRYVVERWVTKDQVAKVDGENYSAVPILRTPVSDD